MERKTDDFGGQVAIVTGGSRGIGRAISLGLAARGAHVVVASRSSDSIDSVAAEITALGQQAEGIRTDVSRIEDIERLVSEVRNRCGRIDVLVNNAGINPLFRRPEFLTPEDWDLIMNVDLRG